MFSRADERPETPKADAVGNGSLRSGLLAASLASQDKSEQPCKRLATCRRPGAGRHGFCRPPEGQLLQRSYSKRSSKQNLEVDVVG